MNEPAELSECPICHRSVRTRRMQKLYGILVCRKCPNGLVNRREVAYLLDYVSFYVLLGALTFAIFSAFPGLVEAADSGNAAAIIAIHLYAWILAPLLFCMKDGFGGQSPGKWLMGVRAVDKDTLAPIGFASSFRRNLITLIPFGALIVALQLPKGLRWGDKWAKTRVVLKKHAHRPPFDIRGILCTHCGYNLTGNVSGRCPECGHDVPVIPGRVPIAMPVAQG